MSKLIDSSLFTASSFAKLLQGIEGYEQLGKRIVGKIKQAHAFRQVETVKELARILANVPIKEYQLIGQYYLVWCICRAKKLHTGFLERIVEQSQTYKTKALISIAGFEGLKGNIESELHFYTEALKTSPSPSEYIDIMKSIAVIKAKEGFNHLAIKDLEKIIPILKHAEPLVYFDVLNSYAVELAESNRLSEAYNVSLLTVSSPFGQYYSEWQDTHSGIASKRKRRSTISVPDLPPITEDHPSNVILFPGTQETTEQDFLSTLTELGGVPLTPMQMLGIILRVVLKDRITNDEIDRICSAFYSSLKEIYNDD